MKPKYLIYIFSALISCKNSNQTEKEVDFIIKDSEIKQSFDLKNHSDFFNRTLDLLKKENYSIEAINQDSTEFIAYEGKDIYPIHAEIKKILIPNINKTTYRVKRIYPITKGGNDFVKFNITELYFDNDSIAKNKKFEIDSIIDFTGRIDLINDKNYDYIIQKSNRIIYVSCKSMSHSYSSDSLKSKIENLIK